MAESLDFVLGGISLSPLLDQCVSIIGYVNSGIHHDQEQVDAAVSLTLLGDRLRPWEKAHNNFQDNGENRAQRTMIAQHPFQHIRVPLHELHKLSRRQNRCTGVSSSQTIVVALFTRMRPPSPAAPASVLQGDELSNKRCANVLSLLGIRDRRALSLAKKMNSLLAKFKRFVTSLKPLFPDDQRETCKAAYNEAPTDRPNIAHHMLTHFCSQLHGFHHSPELPAPSVPFGDFA